MQHVLRSQDISFSKFVEKFVIENWIVRIAHNPSRTNSCNAVAEATVNVQATESFKQQSRSHQQAELPQVKLHDGTKQGTNSVAILSQQAMGYI
jgi:hypothetical protein